MEESTNVDHERPLYFLVLCSDTGAPVVEAYETLQGVATKLIELRNTAVTVMPFCGRRLYVSQGEMRYLLDEGHHEPIPLFTVPEPGKDATWDGIVRLGTSETEVGIALGTPADASLEDEDEVVEEEEIEEEE